MASTKIEYIDQSAQALCLSLIEGGLDKERFTVIQSGRFAAGDLRIKASIIGSSHLLEFTAGAASFYEVFACMDGLDASQTTFHKPLKDIAGPVELILHCCRYSFTSEVCGRQEGKAKLKRLERAAALANAGENGVGLAYEFPTERIDAPKTIVVARFDSGTDNIEIETAHSYPNEDTIVFTKSKIAKQQGS